MANEYNRNNRTPGLEVFSERGYHAIARAFEPQQRIIPARPRPRSVPVCIATAAPHDVAEEILRCAARAWPRLKVKDRQFLANVAERRGQLASGLTGRQATWLKGLARNAGLDWQP